MTIREALLAASGAFQEKEFETPYLDAVVLLSASAGMDKTRLFASFTDEVTEEANENFAEAVRRRLSGLPVSYILRRKEFFGLNFYVDERVLVPRPDTEILVETAVSIVKSDSGVRRIHDACTGTGCIPISMAVSLQDFEDTEISVSDISEEALDVFRINSGNLLGRVLPHTQSDLLESVPGPFDMITANPPYIIRSEALSMRNSGWPEPLLALDGGERGFDLLLRLIEEAVDRLQKNGYLLMEATDSQAEELAEAFKQKGYTDVHTLCDLAGHRRLTMGRRGA